MRGATTEGPMAIEAELQEEVEPLGDSVLLEEFVRALVRAPGRVRVEECERGPDTVFKVHVAPEDRRYIIGREGQTVTTLRRLFGVLAAQRGRRSYIEIVETREERAARRHPPARTPSGAFERRP